MTQETKPTSDDIRLDEWEKPPFVFTRYVDGIERAEGVKINQADTLEQAMLKAVALCPERGTVLVYRPDPQPSPELIAMVREKDESSFAWEDLYRRAEARVTAAEERAVDALATANEYRAHMFAHLDSATAAEAKVKELEGELDTIVRGRYDGLEVTHYSANECRNIARAALRR